METQRTTALFPIDNRKPTIDAVTVRYPQASARASDTISVVAEMAYSVAVRATTLGVLTAPSVRGGCSLPVQPDTIARPMISTTERAIIRILRRFWNGAADDARPSGHEL